jgi:hypothetical protein
MRTIAVASSKGGVGKTTLACCLAWRASLESGPVAAIDLNRDQGNFEQWAGLRDKPLKGIELIKDYGDLTETLPKLAVAGFKWTIIDTMPGDLDVIELATLVSDVLLVPIKTSITRRCGSSQCSKSRGQAEAVLLRAGDVDTRHKVLNASAGQLKTWGLWSGHISHLQSTSSRPAAGSRA